MASFQKAADERFLDHATSVMAWRYERHFSMAPRAELRKAVEEGHRRASGAGLRQAEQIVEFIDLAFSLGAEFDEDPFLPWASRILGDRGHVDEAVWIGRLITRADLFRETVIGEDGRYFLMAAERLAGQPARADDMDESSLAAFLKALYPQKSAALSPEALSSLREQALGSFTASPPSPPLLNLHMGAMFIFGSGYLRDHLLLALCGKDRFDLNAITATQFQMMLTKALGCWQP